MVSFSSGPNAGNGNSRDVSIDALAQLPGIVVLPSIGTDASVSQRHEVNPAIATKVLQDIQAKVSILQTRLRQIVQSLRALERQGPMVDGWLESSADVAAAKATDTSLFRHGDTDALMRYVDALDQSSQPAASPVPVPMPEPFPQADPQSRSQTDSRAAEKSPTQYRLCRLDNQGKMHCQACPPEQLGTVSIAIARHQKYKQLLLQKQVIESKLQRTVDNLTSVRDDLAKE